MTKRDILKRLRALAATCGCGACEDAADEIERLRAHNTALEACVSARASEMLPDLRAEIERLRHRNAALVEIVRSSLCPYNGRATGVTVGECQQCGCSHGLLTRSSNEEDQSRALQIADERSRENAELRAALAALQRRARSEA